MKVLIAPGHYFLSDKYGSEPFWAWRLITGLFHIGVDMDVIVGFSDLSSSPPKNLKLFSIYATRSPRAFFELIRYLLFFPLLTLSAIKMLFSTKYSVLHHMFPASPWTFNPTILAVKLLRPDIKIVLGPLQLPQTASSPREFNVMLTGNAGSLLESLLLFPTFKIITFIFTPFSRLMYHLVDIIVCNSHQSSSYFQKKFPSKKIIAIPTGVDLPSASQARQRDTRKFKILSVGQLTSRKGQIYLLRAFKEIAHKFPHVEMSLVGDGELKDEYQKFVNNSGLSNRVHFLGRIAHSQMSKVYSSHHIFCLPSISDSSPTVILEAMAHGLPTVASATGSVKEMIGDTGIAVEPGNAKVLYEAISQLISHPQIISKLSMLAKKRVRSVYSWDNISVQWAKLYESLTNHIQV